MMKKTNGRLGMFVMLVLLVCGMAQRADAETLTPGDFDHSMKLTFAGYAGGRQTLTNFPVLVKLGEGLLDGFDYGDFASNDGYDLRFTDSDGTTVISYEVEAWDTNGTSLVWVQVPELAGDGTDSIKMYWGSSDALSTTPDEVSGLALWLDASTGVETNGSAVTNWIDQSSNGHNLFQSNASYQPAFVSSVAALGNKPALRFSADRLSAVDLGIASGQDRTVIFVCIPVSTDNSEIFGSATSQMFDFGTWLQSNRLRVRNDAVNAYSGSDTVPYSQPNLVAVRTKSGATHLSAWVDGTVCSAMNDLSTTAFNWGMSAVSVGWSTYGGREYKGDIAEFIVFDRTLEDAELNSIGYYLADKYGLSTDYTEAPSYTTDGSTWSEDFGGVWHMGDSDGSTMSDSSGTGNNGSYINTPTLEAGQVADATYYNSSSSEYSSVPHDTTLNANDNFTVSTWVKTTYAGAWYRALVAKYGGTPFWGLGWSSANHLAFSVRGSSVVHASASSGWGLDGEWHLLTGVRGGGKIRLYGDGVLISEQNDTAGTATSTEPLRFATHNASEFSPARLDEVRFVNDVRSADWVWASYQMVKAPNTFIHATLDPADYTHKMKITFSGHTSGDTLTNFPALVKLPLMVGATALSPDGYDLRFADSNGVTVLNYEIEEWDAAGESTVWVQVPELEATGTDCIWAYWGNSGATNTAPTYTTDGSTWTEGYAGVWHKHRTSGDSLDSSPYGNDGTPDAGINRSEAGKIDGCDELDGSSDYYNLPTGSELMGTDGFSISAWCKSDALSGLATGRGTIYSTRNSGSEGFTLWIENYDGGGNKIYFYSRQHGKSVVTGSGVWTADEWAHVVMTHDEAGSVQKIYVNGVEKASGAETLAFNATTMARIGREGTGSYYYNGHLDEVRMSTVPRSADWVQASYQVTASNDTFISLGEITAGAHYWDTSTAADLQAGNGTWDGSTALWSDSTSGSDPLQAWSAGQVANFTPSGVSTVTVSGTVTAMGMVFDGTGYTVTDGTILLGATGITANVDATLGSAVSGSDGLLKDGSGALTFGGAGMYDGSTTISNGTLQLAEGSAPTVSGCVMWVKADAGIQTNASGYVTTWTDQSGNGNDAVAGGAPLFVEDSLNGYPVLSFDGSSHYLEVADESAFDFTTEMTVFVFCKAYSDSGTWRPFVSKYGEGSQGWQIRRKDANNYASFTIRGTSADPDDPSGSTAINDAWRLFAGRYDGSRRKLWVSGNLDIDIADTGTIGQCDYKFVLGARDSGSIGSHAHIDIAEVMVYDRALTDSEREQIEHYLMSKWLRQSSPIPEDSSLAVAQSAALDMSGYDTTVASVENAGSTGGVVTNTSATAVTLTIDGGDDKGFSGVIADGAGAIALTKTGSETQTLSGANTYSGATIVQDGTLVLSGANTGGGTITVNGGTLSLSGGDNRVLASTTVTLDNNTILNINAATQTLANVAIKDHNESTTVSGSAGGMLNLSGAVTIATGGNSDRTETLRLNGLKTTATTLTIGKNNSTNWRWAKGYLHVNGGTLTATEIALAHSLYSSGTWNPPSEGELTISNAVVKVSTFKLGQTPDGGTTVKGRVNLNYGGDIYAETIGWGSGTGGDDNRFNWNDGTVHNYDTSTDLTISQISDDAVSFTLLGTGLHAFDISSNRVGTVSQVISGTGDLVKTGDGLVMLNAVNTYSGGTTVSNGYLWGTGSILESTLSVEAGATIGQPATGTTLDTFSVSNVTLAADARLACFVNSNTPSLSISGALTTSSTNWIDLILGGSTLVNSTNVLVDYTGSIGGDGYAAFKLGATLGDRATVTLSNNTVDTTIDLIVTINDGEQGIKWKGNINSTWDLGSTTNWITNPGGSGITFLPGDDVIFDDTASLFGVNASQVVSPGSILVTNDTHAYTIGGQPIAGTTGLDKYGTNVLTLTANNTYTGSTTIEQGILRLGADNVLADSSSVSNSATLDINGYTETIDNLSIGGTVDIGNGSLTVGSLAFNANLSGDGVVTNGTLDVTTIKPGQNGVTTGGVINSDITRTGDLNIDTRTAGSSLTLEGAISVSGQLLVNSVVGSAWSEITLAGNTDNDIPLLFVTANLSYGDVRNKVVLAKTGGAIAANSLKIDNNRASAYVQLGADEQIADTGTIWLRLSSHGYNYGSRFIMNGFDETVAGVHRNSSYVYSTTTPYDLRLYNGSATDSTLTFEGSGTYDASYSSDYRHSVYFYDGAAGKLNIVKNGTGTQIISLSKYTGDTTVNNGTLCVRNNSTIWDSDITINASGTLDANATSGTMQMGNGESIAGAGTFVKTGAGIVDVYNDTITLSGQINVEAGTLRNNGNSANWSGCTADMDISAGATLDLYADDIYVDSLTGAGTVNNGHAQAQSLYIGVANGDGTFSGSIADSGGNLSIVKSGTGTLTLSGVANTYGGTTTINGGTLLVNGTHTGGATYTVNSGGTLGGIGTIGSSVSAVSGGTIEAGANSLTSLTLNGNLTMTSGSTAKFFGGGADSSKLTVNGAVALNNTTLGFTFDSIPNIGSLYVVVDNDGVDAVTGTFNGLAQGDIYMMSYNGGNYQMTVSYSGDSASENVSGGNDVVLSYEGRQSVFMFK